MDNSRLKDNFLGNYITIRAVFVFDNIGSRTDQDLMTSIV